jgi:hypothetical protein
VTGTAPDRSLPDAGTTGRDDAVGAGGVATPSAGGSTGTGRPRGIAAAAGSIVALALGLVAVPTAGAHAGGLGATSGSVVVPEWLYFLTGGGVVAGSFLATSFLTDRELIVGIHGWRRRLPGRFRLVRLAVRAAGVAVLVAVVVVGLVGPTEAIANLGVLVVWVGWWAGYTASTYLLGNTWPLLNPWRTLADSLPLPTPTGKRSPPVDGDWLAAAGLLGLVWIEVVSPLADAPRLLALAVLAYTAVSLTGAALYDDWFDRIDPVSRVFRYYGAVAPFGWDEETGLRLRLPGSALVSGGDHDRDPYPDSAAAAAGPISTAGDVAFVIALLWGTSFDGLVTTAAWGWAVRTASTVVPAAVVYPVALLAGFGLFYAAYRWAARNACRVTGTPLESGLVAVRFAGALLPIAAAYHLAHYLSYLLTFLPTLLGAAADPLSPGQLPALVLPDWFGAVGLALVVLGHVLAVWIAHAVAFDVFVGRLQPVRSQYPYVVVMVLYTVISMWMLAQPYTEPPLI